MAKCEYCGGSKLCSTCGGAGRTEYLVVFYQTCPTCKGKELCRACKGTGQAKKN